MSLILQNPQLVSKIKAEQFLTVFPERTNLFSDYLKTVPYSQKVETLKILRNQITGFHLLSVADQLTELPPKNIKNFISQKKDASGKRAGG